VQNLIEAGVKLRDGTTPKLAEYPYGSRFQEGHEYIFSEEFASEYRHLIDKIIHILGETKFDQAYTEDVIWEIICSNLEHKNYFSVFKEIILDEIAIPRLCVLPNYQIRFDPGLEEISIGPVRAALGNILAQKLNDLHNSKGLDFVVNINNDINPAIISQQRLDAVCWEVEVKSTQESAQSEAIWITNVALSLIRVLTLHNVNTGMFPSYGDVEPAISPRPYSRDRVYIHRGDEVWLGRVDGFNQHQSARKTDDG